MPEDFQKSGAANAANAPEARGQGEGEKLRIPRMLGVCF